MEKIKIVSKKTLAKYEKARIAGLAGKVMFSAPAKALRLEAEDMFRRHAAKAVAKYVGLPAKLIETLKDKRLVSGNSTTIVRAVISLPPRMGDKSDVLDTVFVHAEGLSMSSSEDLYYVNLTGKDLPPGKYPRYSHQHAEWLTIPPRFAKAIQDRHYQSKQKDYERLSFRERLSAVLANCRTIEQALDKMPDLAKFVEVVPKEKTTVTVAGTDLVPAELINGVNTLLKDFKLPKGGE